MTQGTGSLNADCRLPTVLATGGCGFIGTNLVKLLSEMGYKVRILDNLSTSSRIWSPNHQPTLQTQLTQQTEATIDLMVGDIRDREVVDRAVKGMDVVVHLAAHTSVVESLENPKEDWDINVNGTLNLLEACRQKGVEKFIFASSNAAVGDQPPPINGSIVPRPLSPYGASKLASEALCFSYYRSFGLETISLRFANCYGPHSEHTSSVIARFIKWAREGKPLKIYGDGNQTRDFIYVDDICRAIYLTLVTADYRLSADDCRLFQIGTGIETSINELAQVIREIAQGNMLGADCQLSAVYKPERRAEIKRNYCDISNARAALRFQPKIILKEGLKKLWNLYDAGFESVVSSSR